MNLFEGAGIEMQMKGMDMVLAGEGEGGMN